MSPLTAGTQAGSKLAFCLLDQKILGLIEVVTVVFLPWTVAVMRAANHVAEDVFDSGANSNSPPPGNASILSDLRQ